MGTVVNSQTIKLECKVITAQFQNKQDMDKVS